MKTSRGLAVGMLLLAAGMARAAAVDVIPLPATAEATEGTFTLSTDSVVLAHPQARAEAAQLVAQLAPALGTSLTAKTAASLGRLKSSLRLCGRRLKPNCRSWIRFVRVRDKQLGDEGYRLDVQPGSVLIRARGAAGWFYGAQTLRQLLPAAILGDVAAPTATWTAPAVSIRDQPRFGYRGIMLDSARHFFPPATVLRLLDQMALHKLNVLHWHLSDDQGWRLPIPAYPQLTTVGSQRSESTNRLLPHGGFLNFFASGGLGEWTAGFDGVPYGGFYSQDDVRAIVAHASALHILIVPELDMPGHAQAAIAAYPSLGSAPDPVAVKTTWGLPKAILNPSEETFTFIAAVIDELTTLFPGPYLHMGGDEVDLTQWKTNPIAQARRAELGLTDEAALKNWFVNRVMQIIIDHKRRPIGWNEVLHDGLPSLGVVMSWTSQQPGLTAVRQGYDVIMAPLASTYLDHANGLPLPSAEQTLLETLSGSTLGLAPLFVTDVHETYAFDPVLPAMSLTESAHVLGGQGQLWAEFIHDQSDIDRQAFPRLCALAEVLWSPVTSRNVADFDARLATHRERLDALGIGYYRPEVP